ncbi:FHA domain-containing protein [Thermomonospora cellulosilytica]|uniref:FHA domain-containing protein n=1 Tax=Thermomonospora cellulosilytica TaxID=1411118 RepID=A0A7W3MW97_9ACTN|nr:FHA domain-containing protein [Thermomonospora cellulosilytica]MBA9002962.1 hypothetical protein [Thermomonospora cellulosilytica]
MKQHAPQVRYLPPTMRSLATDVPPSPAGTLFMLAATGGIAVPPRRDFAVLFGRNEPEVHVCVGAGDPHVSRRHGRLLCDGSGWWIRNEGRLPIRMPHSTLLLSGEEMPLNPGYSPLFIRSSPRREHLLEVRIVGTAPPGPVARPDDPTLPRRPWTLSDTERLVLTALAQRYLRQEAYPQPQSWRQVAEELNELTGRQEWNPHRAANVVGEVRSRLSAAGVRGLTRDEVGEPVGNALNDRLIRELLETTTLVPPDLRLLGDPGD